MDPDMVRQQEEEEAASLLRAKLAREAPPKPEPLVVELVPPSERAPAAAVILEAAVSSRAAMAAEAAASPRPSEQVIREAVAAAQIPHEQPPHAEVSRGRTSARRSFWGLTFYGTCLTAAGILAAAMAGARFHMPPLEVFLAAAVAGYVMGWSGVTGWLRRYSGFRGGRASGAALWPVAVIWITQLMAVAFAPRFAAAEPLIIAGAQFSGYWVFLAAGFITSYVFGLPAMRDAVSR